MKKKILIISNNALSETKNNGKTLSSFFDDNCKYDIAQIYFYNELPSSIITEKYFRIHEKDILISLKERKNSVGCRLRNNLSRDIGTDVQTRSSLFKVKKNNFTSLIRELLWVLSFSRLNDCIKFAKEFNPDIIFFCAGDSIFAYKITKIIQSKLSSKLAVFITDDYILPHMSISPFYLIRRQLLLKQMSSTIKDCDKFFTISDPMKNEYRRIFNKDSFVVSNIPTVNKTKILIDGSRYSKNKLNLIYAGGFHYGRMQTILKLIEAIKNYNLQGGNHKKVFLKIFSNADLNEREIQLLNNEGSSMFLGSLDKNELEIELLKCDIPVFIESFSKSNIRKTKLSLSTKINEYVSCEKCILAIGPNEIGSIEFLRKLAYCITGIKDIQKMVNNLFDNDLLMEEYASKCVTFNENNSAELIHKKFDEYLLS